MWIFLKIIASKKPQDRGEAVLRFCGWMFENSLVSIMKRDVDGI